MTNLSQTLCSLKNAQLSHKRSLSVPFSKLVWSLLKILVIHGYIRGFFRQASFIHIFLKQNQEGGGSEKSGKFPDLNKGSMYLTKVTYF